MRGKVLCHRVRAGRIGITPAYAGKSARGIFRFGPVRDHPRVCGERIFCHSVVLRLLGSPPRMRGKVTLEVTYATKPGITPAYAGKSIRATAILRQSRDHPRVCGEKPALPPGVLAPPGSPPRMRGKAFLTECRHSAVGITPAYAGKRLKRSHSIGHFSCILCLFHSVLHRASVSDGSRAGPCAPPCLPAQNAVPV